MWNMMIITILLLQKNRNRANLLCKLELKFFDFQSCGYIQVRLTASKLLGRRPLQIILLKLFLFKGK